ncbi:MAG: DUF402 domain-containing protein [Mycoplasmoidaceae bacterium]|nr:DUF402 domain-containing protein [Mycoplasmoidaceae bacterium]
MFVTINEDKKINYYFNVASPYIFEEDAIKYIDLDLDVRVIDVNSQLEIIKVLDEREFEAHAKQMLYPKKLITKSIDVKDEIIKKLENKEFQRIFNEDIFKKLEKQINTTSRKRHEK